MESALEEAFVDFEKRTQGFREPMVIGLYGIPGSGKSFLMNYLKNYTSTDHFAFYEGSDMIASLVPGGLEAFQALGEQRKAGWRGRAIEEIKKDARANKKIAIVTAYFMFWSEEQAIGQPVYTLNEFGVVTHIIYLNTPPALVSHRHAGARYSASIEHLQKWQEAEIVGLRHLCPQHGILFHVLTHPTSLCSKALAAVELFCQTNIVNSNRNKIVDRVENFFAGVDNDQFETALVLDADRTLTPMDTGVLFWQTKDRSQSRSTSTCPLQELFGGPLGYTDKAFYQATLLYVEAAEENEFDILCETTASSVVMHPEFVSLLRAAAERKHIFSVVVTCGLARVWEKVLEKEGLSSTVKVLGGGRISDGWVVVPTTKADIVAQLRHDWNMYTWAFGDSPLDIPMLRAADEAIVVVGYEGVRSSCIDLALIKALGTGRPFKPQQALLPSHVSLRLDKFKLPRVRLDDPEFVEYVLCHRLKMLHATDKDAARLLMFPMKDAATTCPTVMKMKQRVGQYLATEFVVQLIGLEPYFIPEEPPDEMRNELGIHRLVGEDDTLVVGLMGDGRDMACGVREAFPTGTLMFAESTSDITDRDVRYRYTVILVDSTINSGQTMIGFIRHIRKFNPTIRIVVMTGVIQASSIGRIGALRSAMQHAHASLAALTVVDDESTDSDD